jgi:hypothetical protein
MTNTSAPRRKKQRLPVRWMQGESFEPRPVALAPHERRPWEDCALLIHLSEGDTTRIVRPQPRL